MEQRNFNLTHNFARSVGAAFLRNIRREVARRSLNEDRLPRWIKAARVRVGWINDSIVIVYEDAPQNDTYEILGPVGADTVVLLNIDDFRPVGASLAAREIRDLIVIIGRYDQAGQSTIVLVGSRPAFYNCGFAGYHGPRVLLNIFIQHAPDPATGPVAMRYIPFALYVHKTDTADSISLWHRCEERLMTNLAAMHDSETGTYYSTLAIQAA
jgi:hypothetical protein